MAHKVAKRLHNVRSYICIAGYKKHIVSHLVMYFVMQEVQGAQQYGSAIRNAIGPSNVNSVALIKILNKRYITLFIFVYIIRQRDKT
jgi:hypothetical protein